MNIKSSDQALIHWAQLLSLFLLPGAIQGAAFYLVVEGMHDVLPGWRVFAVWFLVIAPTCVFLISTPQDRWRSIVVGVLLALVLSGLFYFDTKDALGTDLESGASGSSVAVAIVCSLVVIFSALPFYRTRWQRGLPFSNYASLFECAWNQTVCVLVGLAFTGLVAALVALTVALFDAVGFSLDKWLWDTALMGAWAGGAFAIAIGVTRQSDSVVLGTRVLLLALLRILLPVMLPICVVFVALVGVLGVDRVDTGLSIALIMIAAAITAIILISARIDDAQEQLTRFQQLLTRSMAVMVLPLSLLAVHALWFRVLQYGWTGQRVLATIVIAMCVLYGSGYLVAAVRDPRFWIPIVNRWMAGLCAMVALLLVTPLLDPDRLGVNDQIARFHDGRTSAEQLDLGYLKFQSGRIGREALAALSSRPESKEQPLKARLERLTNVDDKYQLEFENVSLDILKTVEYALIAGTFRLLEEHSSGWVKVTEPSRVSELIDNEFFEWGSFEITEFCEQQAHDCAYLTSSFEADLLAIRISDIQMTFYVLPMTNSSDQLPEVLGPDQLPEALESGELPRPPFPTFAQQPTQFSSQFDTADIDAWFSSLDSGQVPTETVQVPAFTFGPFRILRSETLLPQ